MASQKTTHTKARINSRINRLRKRTAVVMALTFVVTLAAGFVTSALLARRPEAIVRQALANSLQAEAADVNLELTISARGQQPGTWRANGFTARNGVFQLDGTYAETGSTGRALGVSARSPDGKDAFVRLSDVAQLRTILGDEAADYGITAERNPLQQVEGRWLRVPADLKETVLRNQSATVGQPLDDADRHKLASLYMERPFLRVVRPLPVVATDAPARHHFELAIDRPLLRSYLEAVQRSVPKLQLTGKQAASLEAAVGTVRHIEVWITGRDSRFSRIDFRLADDSGSWQARLDVGNYGRDPRVGAPADAVPLFEALSGLSQVNTQE